MGEKANVSVQWTAVNTATGKHTSCVSDRLRRTRLPRLMTREAGATTLNE
jgi:hypothetical protein